MAYQNPRLQRLNDERAGLPASPPFEPYDARGLLEGTRNFAENFGILWHKGIDLSQEQAENARQHYRNLREILMSLGVDVRGLPRRLRIKVKGELQAA